MIMWLVVGPSQTVRVSFCLRKEARLVEQRRSNHQPLQWSTNAAAALKDSCVREVIQTAARHPKLLITVETTMRWMLVVSVETMMCFTRIQCEWLTSILNISIVYRKLSHFSTPKCNDAQNDKGNREHRCGSEIELRRHSIGTFMMKENFRFGSISDEVRKCFVYTSDIKKCHCISKHFKIC